MNKAIINKKAYHDYFIIEEFEAGIQLFGAEVKSIRNGRINFKDSFVKIKKNEAYLINTHISVYEKVSSFDSYNPTRNRKLLLHKKEINKIRGKVEEKGMSMVPLSAYFNKQNFFKIKIAIVKGKHNFDKKQSLKEKDLDKQARKEMKRFF